MNGIYGISQKPARLTLFILLILSKCDMDVEYDAQTDTLTKLVSKSRSPALTSHSRCWQRFSNSY